MTEKRPRSFRLSEEAHKILDRLQRRLGIKKAPVIEMALRNLDADTDKRLGKEEKTD